MKSKCLKVIAFLLVCILVLFSGCSTGSLSLTGSEKNTYDVSENEATVKSVPNKSSVTEIVIPDEYEGVPVTKIDDFAAVNLEYVKNIKIGKNVKTIGDWAFANNQQLVAFEVDPENQYFCSVDGVLFTKDMKTLVSYPIKKGVTIVKDKDNNEVEASEYTIPDGVETIRSKAFYKCRTIQKLTFPASVKSIEEKAFFRCEQLEDFVLPNGIQQIGKDAFSYCTKLTTLTIPKSIIAIGDYAFYSCTALLNITVMKAEADITLGEKWYPTNNGIKIDECNIVFKP